MEQSTTLEKLFFEPTISQLKALSSDDFIISSVHHKLISNEKKFLGIKKNKYLESKEIFLLKHKDAFELGKMLFQELSYLGGNGLNFYHSEDKSWVAFLFSEDEKLETEDQNPKSDNMFGLIDDFQNQSKYESRHDQMDIFGGEKMPEGIDIVVGVSSGYSEDNVPTFYLVLKHIHKSRPCLLTIDSSKFSIEDIEKYLKRDCDIEVLRAVIKKRVAADFDYQLKSFIRLYNLLSKIPVSLDYFVPVCLDLYNLNRSLTSLKNDKNLQRRVESLIRNSKDFISGYTNDSNCSIFIDFIIRNNYVNLESIVISRDRVEELFMQKRAYQKVESIFPSFGKSQKNFQDYLEDQKEIMQKVIEALREGDAMTGFKFDLL